MPNEAEIEGNENIIAQGISNSTVNIYARQSDTDQKPTPLPKIISTQNLTPPQYFTGREKVLEDITETLQTHRKASLCGISGLGKSSVVLKFADKKREVYQHIIFIRVDRLGFEANIDKTCESLNLKFTQEDNEESKAAKFCRRIEEICENLTENKWLLLIFDNVDEVERLQKFLPNHERLNILLTSNFERVNRLGQQVEFGNLSESEAMLLLYRVATLTDAETTENLTDEEQTTIKEIVNLFGFHPLAIFIAGNYINENKKTFAKYLARLQNSQGKILKDEKGVDAYQHQTIYSAFEIAFNAICNIENKSAEEQTPISIARECMKIASVLAADNMPEEVFWETAALINPDWQEYLADEDNRDQVYQKLSQYKLFDRDGEANSFSIHRLVRLFFDDRLKNERQTIEEPLVKVLARYFQEFNFTNKTEIERFLSHIEGFLDYLEKSISYNQFNIRLINTATAKLCNNFALFHLENGNYEIAEKYYKISKNICEEIIDINPEFLAASYNNLALLYKKQQRYEEAESLYVKANNLLRSKLGETNLDTAISYDNLALLYQKQGKYKEAELLHIKAKNIFEESLGENHLNTAKSYNNLALLYNSQGKNELAKPLFIKSKDIREKILGKNHPLTAASYLNLGALYFEQGKLKEGLELCQQALNIFQNTLPVGHPQIQNCESWIDGIKNSIGK